MLGLSGECRESVERISRQLPTSSPHSPDIPNITFRLISKSCDKHSLAELSCVSQCFWYKTYVHAANKTQPPATANSHSPLTQPWRPPHTACYGNERQPFTRLRIHYISTAQHATAPHRRCLCLLKDERWVSNRPSSSSIFGDLTAYPSQRCLVLLFLHYLCNPCLQTCAKTEICFTCPENTPAPLARPVTLTSRKSFGFFRLRWRHRPSTTQQQHIIHE